MSEALICMEEPKGRAGDHKGQYISMKREV
jgi:hypothetical protein